MHVNTEDGMTEDLYYILQRAYIVHVPSSGSNIQTTRIPPTTV